MRTSRSNVYNHAQSCKAKSAKLLMDRDPRKLNHENIQFVPSAKFTCLEILYIYGIYNLAAESGEILQISLVHCIEILTGEGLAFQRKIIRLIFNNKQLQKSGRFHVTLRSIDHSKHYGLRNESLTLTYVSFYKNYSCLHSRSCICSYRPLAPKNSVLK